MWKRERVGAELLHDMERIDDVAFRLAHFLPFGIAHEGVDVYVTEGDIARELESEHDHPGYPEEEDVEACDEH